MKNSFGTSTNSKNNYSQFDLFGALRALVVVVQSELDGGLFCKIFINLSPVPKAANFLRLRGVSSGQLVFCPAAGWPA